jgi:hypothetical protein
MAQSSRILDVMTTGMSMARLFYSPSIMSLLEQPIPTREFYAIKPERPHGYSQSHWRKIQKERWKRAAGRPRTFGSREWREQYECRFDCSTDAADAMVYALRAAATQSDAPTSPGTPRSDSTPRCTPGEGPRPLRDYDP